MQGAEEGRGREVVGVFSDGYALDAAVEELLNSGFDLGDISLLAGEKAVVAKLGHKYQKVEDVEDEDKAPRVAYVPKESRATKNGAIIGALVYVGAAAAAGAVLASGGPLAMLFISGVVGAEFGGLIGAVLGEFMEERHAKFLQEQLDHGGLLLWVRTRDSALEDKAKRIIARHSGRDVHAHDRPVATA
jgi:outer membrane lipoprotein SlyB